MTTLVPHPSAPGPKRFRMNVEATRRRGRHLHLWFRASGTTDVSLNEAWNTGGSKRLRRDKLWKHTCCEAFIRTPSGYCELNFAPNGDWAAYRFTSYRKGMSLPEMATPIVDAHRRGDDWQLQAFIDMGAFQDLDDAEPWRAALSVVVETKDRVFSYWALAHPTDEPDFHHPDSFTLTLPAPESA